ncbi:MAG: MFS transporter [Phycisphaerales bacterium]|nr:MFS transporter [Phycisphaerales bacterium]
MSDSKKHEFMIHYPRGFRPRRGLNWIALGLLYASYYMCRYNFPFATPGLVDEFGFDKTQISDMFAIWSLAYGTGQLVNGLLSDRIGGKRSMLIGAIGTIAINFIFGFSSFVSSFATFSLIALMNGYLQSFGAPGMVKINAAWFHRTERGTFAGIFGGMIQLGLIAINQLGPVILAGFVVLGYTVGGSNAEWRWLFRIPPLFTAAAALLMFFTAKESPEAAGYPDDVVVDEIDDSAGVTVPLLRSLKTIVTHPLVWFYAVAYACTGAVRHSTENLKILYFVDQLKLDMEHPTKSIAITLGLMPLVAFLGSLSSGIISDKLFKGRRAPVAAALYFFEALVIMCAAFILLRGMVNATPGGVFVGCTILVLISLTVNSTHSIVGAAAPMDIGGKKMAGFAAGVIDSFQYYGAAISLAITGRVLDATEEQHGWLYWYVIMAGFGVIGGLAMLGLMRRQRQLKRQGRIVRG